VGSLKIDSQTTIRSWTQANDLPHFACLLTYDVGSYSYAHQRAGWRLN